MFDTVRVGAGQIHFIHGDDDTNAGGFGVLNGFDRLRHDAVIGGDDEYRDVGDVSTASPHSGKGRVAGGVEEGDSARIHIDRISADMLGDAAGFARDHFGVADAIEQRGFAVVNMAHKGDDRWTDFEIFGPFLFDRCNRLARRDFNRFG